MPLNADPAATIPFVLTTDRDKPEAERPVFHLRYLTDKDYGRIATIEKQIKAIEDDGPDLTGKVEEVIFIGVVGWERMTLRGEPVPYPTNPSDFLTPGELWELYRAVKNEPRVSEEDKKKSISQSTTKPENSAETATPPASA